MQLRKRKLPELLSATKVPPPPVEWIFDGDDDGSLTSTRMTLIPEMRDAASMNMHELCQNPNARDFLRMNKHMFTEENVHTLSHNNKEQWAGELYLEIIKERCYGNAYWMSAPFNLPDNELVDFIFEHYLTRPVIQDFSKDFELAQNSHPRVVKYLLKNKKRALHNIRNNGLCLNPSNKVIDYLMKIADTNPKALRIHEICENKNTRIVNVIKTIINGNKNMTELGPYVYEILTCKHIEVAVYLRDENLFGKLVDFMRKYYMYIQRMIVSPIMEGMMIQYLEDKLDMDQPIGSLEKSWFGMTNKLMEVALKKCPDKISMELLLVNKVHICDRVVEYILEHYAAFIGPTMGQGYIEWDPHIQHLNRIPHPKVVRYLHEHPEYLKLKTLVHTKCPEAVRECLNYVPCKIPCTNPAIFECKYGMKTRQYFREYIAAELMARVWHPRNIARFADWGVDSAE